MERTRRQLLESCLAAAAVAGVAGVPRSGFAGEPVECLGLRPGLRLGAWTVLGVQAKADAIALVVEGPEGEPYQLDVLARDPACPGVAQSREYDVYLVNGGDGSTRSDEERARGALAVGHYLRWAERSSAWGAPRLGTMSERMHERPRGGYCVL